jgi:thioredoxin-dependent peroxiredoxin
MRRVTFKGNPLTLAGRSLKPGMRAPDFRADTREMKEVSLRSFAGRAVLISAFVSLDTPVCDLQVRDFNKEAAGLSPDVQIIGISKDLPFAQQRFCDAHAIDRELLLSDYRLSSFSINYGMLIKEWNLTARGVVVIDRSGIIRSIEICPEITGAVNLKAALDALKDAVAHPSIPGVAGGEEKCVPCEAGTAPLSAQAAHLLLGTAPGWELLEGKKLVREFGFTGFADAKFFVDLIAAIAQEQGHHPAILLRYGKVKVTLSTHAAGGLTGNDFIMARLINDVSAS